MTHTMQRTAARGRDRMMTEPRETAQTIDTTTGGVRADAIMAELCSWESKLRRQHGMVTSETVVHMPWGDLRLTMMGLISALNQIDAHQARAERAEAERDRIKHAVETCANALTIARALPSSQTVNVVPIAQRLFEILDDAATPPADADERGR